MESNVRKLLLVLIIVLCAALPAVWYWRTANAGPVCRGRRVAERVGCFACHGDGGARGIPDPGYSLGDVPTWTEGILTMYVQSGPEIREWIEDGLPARIRRDPEQMKARQGALVRMPAFRSFVSAGEMSDLVAYVKAVGDYEGPPDGPASDGLKVAVGAGCLGCHGPQGRGGIRNPRSLKGYIPSWSGRDFPELARDDLEIREWIQSGGTRRLEANPLARFFLERQALQMPAYGDRLKKDEVDRLIDYIHWLRAHPDEP
jgi:mono/diheme cytochrome c family protein